MSTEKRPVAKEEAAGVLTEQTLGQENRHSGTENESKDSSRCKKLGAIEPSVVCSPATRLYSSCPDCGPSDRNSALDPGAKGFNTYGSTQVPLL